MVSDTMVENSHSRNSTPQRSSPCLEEADILRGVRGGEGSREGVSADREGECYEPRSNARRYGAVTEGLLRDKTTNVFQLMRCCCTNRGRALEVGGGPRKQKDYRRT